MRTVDEYDPVRDVWISAPNMEARRSTLGVATLNDRIYAVVRFKTLATGHFLFGDTLTVHKTTFQAN